MQHSRLLVLPHAEVLPHQASHPLRVAEGVSMRGSPPPSRPGGRDQGPRFHQGVEVISGRTGLAVRIGDTGRPTSAVVATQR